MSGLARTNKRIDEHHCRDDVPGAQQERRDMPVNRDRPGIVRAAVTGTGAVARDDRHPAAATGVQRRARD